MPSRASLQYVTACVKQRRLGAVAHVRDETAARWWRFDDEKVTAMPGGPIGEHGDHGVASAERKVRRYVLQCVFW